MKQNLSSFFLNAIIYFILLSICVGIITLLTGISGVILVRVIIACALAYYKPLIRR